jgi:outer membrane protein TolC
MSRLTIWLNKLVKHAVLPLSVCSVYRTARAQDNPALTLHRAFELAEQNYPLLKQKDLVRQAEKYNIQNLGTGYWPQFMVNGQATYQSDVTKIDIPLPNIKIPEQSKDQYKAIAEADQLLFDGGLTRKQQQLQLANTTVEENKIAVELYNLKTRVSQLYFTILYEEALLKQNQLVMQDIQTGIDKVQPQVENGVTLRSSLQLLQVQLLQARQRSVEISETRKGLLEALAVFLNTPLDTLTSLAVPALPTPADINITRPESTLYSSQIQLLQQQQQLIGARNKPRVQAFVQGGYGRPGLNLLSDQFEPFYIAGLKLNWTLGGLYTARRDKKLLEVNQKEIAIQEDIFLLNTRSQLKQQQGEIDKYAALMDTDQGIIALRHQITEASKAQLENRVITATDYLLQVSAEDQARQAWIIHQLQWLQARVNYSLINGNFKSL